MKKQKNYKNTIKAYLPFFLISIYRYFYYIYAKFKFYKLSNKKIFSKIYKDKMWGYDYGSVYYSGYGSNNNIIVNEFILSIKNFFEEIKIKPKILDIGCGDFEIGKNIYPFSSEYTACDIVPELIEYNKTKFNYPNLRFLCFDATNNKDLPKSDVVLLRQVLQHLCNSQIKIILDKIKGNFKYLILSEHIPINKFIPNKDIHTGDLSRVFINSGIDIEKKPFNYKFKKKIILNEVFEKEGKVQTIVFKLDE